MCRLECGVTTTTQEDRFIYYLLEFGFNFDFISICVNIFLICKCLFSPTVLARLQASHDYFDEQ